MTKDEDWMFFSGKIPEGDLFEVARKMEEEFLENPKEHIIKMIEHQNEWYKEFITLPLFQGRQDRLKIFFDFYKEYSILIGKMLDKKTIHGGVFKDVPEVVKTIQRLKEQLKTIEDYNKNKFDETTALRLARVYASSLETFWKKIKKIIFFAGLNQKDKYLKINELFTKTIELEKIYELNLPNIKSTLNSKLRNSVGHEDTYFIPPNTLVFSERINGEVKEIARFTTEEIYQLLVTITLINIAIHHVENTAMVSTLTPLLKLTNEEIKEKLNNLR